MQGYLGLKIPHYYYSLSNALPYYNLYCKKFKSITYFDCDIFPNEERKLVCNLRFRAFRNTTTNHLKA